MYLHLALKLYLAGQLDVIILVMISSEIIIYIESLLSEKIKVTRPLLGGDINEVYLLATTTQKIVVKLNKSSNFPKMFEAEAKGLQELKKSNTFKIPEILHFGVVGNWSFLMMEYVSSGQPIDNFWEVFGIKLATLHQHCKPYFGLDYDNYIGSLPQYNTKCQSASEFYITQRLEPQFRLAVQKGFSFSKLDTFYKNITKEIINEPSSLIHGDLWSGNYLVDQNGLPCLIDPAIGYAPREMDIAMMQLFGGFKTKLFEVYNEIFPLKEGCRDRIPIFQLYYLLVHLNLFGSSYYNKVNQIVRAHY